MIGGLEEFVGLVFNSGWLYCCIVGLFGIEDVDDPSSLFKDEVRNVFPPGSLLSSSLCNPSRSITPWLSSRIPFASCSSVSSSFFAIVSKGESDDAELETIIGAGSPSKSPYNSSEGENWLEIGGVSFLPI
jgi:hypothetical protein